VQRSIRKEGELRYWIYPPSAKKRDTSMSSYQQLSQEERYTIAALLRSRVSQAEIARTLGRDPGTISRELSRNPTHHDGAYRAELAHGYSTARRKRSRRGSQFSLEQWSLVVRLLRFDLSPEQISNTLKGNGFFSISYETIYKYLLYDKKKGGSLYKHLRNVTKRRRKRYNSHDSRGRLAGKRPISSRPEAINSRNEFGHWEGDTVMGLDRRHCILTLVERKTGYVIIKKLESRTVDQVNSACLAAIKEHKKKFRSITFDNGTEFHGYKEIEAHYPITCYFAAPYHSWERGTNENTNGLIRQYLPKRSCMRHITQADCDWIANRLNTRPRKRHGYKSPELLYNGKDRSLHFMLEARRKFDILCPLSLITFNELIF
jgi:transposase, IS30 family